MRRRRQEDTRGIEVTAQPGQRPRCQLLSVSEGQQDGQRGWRRGMSGRGAWWVRRGP